MGDKQRTREAFKEEVFTRDLYTCRGCGRTPRTDGWVALDAHHITPREEMPNGGYVKENGITLCEACHELAEYVLTHFKNSTLRPLFHKDFLYGLIGGSHAIALKSGG